MTEQQTQPLSGKTALITGAARRIGAALARRLHEAGANIVLHYRRSAPEAEALAGTLCAQRPRSAVTLQCELLETAKLRPLVEQAAAAFGGLDVLVNNASSFYPTAFGEITEQMGLTLHGAHTF